MAETQVEKPIEKAKGVAQEAAKAATTSRPTRTYRTGLFQAGLLSATAAFAMLTFLIKTTPSLPIDVQITRGIQSISSPLFAAFMGLISWPGFGPQSFIIPVVIALALYWFGLHWESVVSVVAALSSVLINLLVKNIIQRPRPTVDLVQVFAVLKSYSFPSGHVMFYLAFFGFLWFLSYTLLKRSLKRTLLLILFGALVLLVGISRIYLGQHWASDVLGAYLLGSLTLVAIILFYRWGKTRYFVRQPVAPEKPKPA